MKKIKSYLELDSMIIRKWFHENHVALNRGIDIVIGENDLYHKIILNNKLLLLLLLSSSSSSSSLTLYLKLEKFT